MQTQAPSNKDFFDKLSSLSGVFIALAGFTASFMYNNNQLKIQQEKASLENTGNSIVLLEKGLKYVNSSNPKEREFGYSIFVISGYEGLALKLINVKSDPAGTKIIQEIAADESSRFAGKAKVTLSKQEEALKFETEGFNFLLDKDLKNALLSFKKSENSYNGFHQVYEISRFLEAKTKMKSENEPLFWKGVYATLLTDYSYGMPKDIQLKLKANQ